MSKKNNANARGIHVSPGIYSKETELTYAVKSLGITTLGLVGETLKGPAFQPTLIENWREFTDVFGGTSAVKFKDTQYPKYELPYIAKSYLTESNQLQVCRVLGLSGYNAGPAWVVTAKGEGEYDNMIVAVLRARGDYETYKKYSTTGDCTCPNEAYDVLTYRVGEFDKNPGCYTYKEYNGNALKLDYYTSITSSGNECSGYEMTGVTDNESEFVISTASNLGRFTIKMATGLQSSLHWSDESEHVYDAQYAVSLNPQDPDYILKVLGVSNDDSDAPVFVESLYDVALAQGVKSGKIDGINLTLVFVHPYQKSSVCKFDSVSGLMSKDESQLTRRDVGLRVLADTSASGITVHAYDIINNKFEETETPEYAIVGQIYTVKQHTDTNGKRHYWYSYPSETSLSGITAQSEQIIASDKLQMSDVAECLLVYNDGDNQYYRFNGMSVQPVTLDMNDYQSAYRFASTPWIVSNIKGDYNKMELNKLFRFHTITDGNTANNQIKVSIENILPDEGLFDVVVRDINDSDGIVIPLEKFGKCSLVPGTNSYIAYKIGSYDGVYESKSKYITVEVNETLTAQNSVPAGFLGYPTFKEGLVPVIGKQSTFNAPVLKYNTSYDEDLKNKKQYFGFSDIEGIDVDMFTYKGISLDENDPRFLTKGFHLDSRLGQISGITVDGESGYAFDTVSLRTRTAEYTETPIIGKEEDMIGCIFEMKNLRKFTVCFFGGFDGWDIYRGSRTNTDDFKMSKYRGLINDGNGEGLNFNRIDDGEALGLNQKGITSDWYAYLSGIRQFANPEAVDINVFATPGIDFVNNKTLVQETIDMIEEERADSIYVVTCPDKPSGAADYEDEMYKPEDIVDELDFTEIDSNYTCTYYPWVKYFDQDNSQYIYLPPTKDVVRNLAMTDNTAYPWFAPAGIGRGDVDCVRAHYVTKLADEDTLYAGRINPIKTFAQDGVKVWGQKNLQARESQLNRIAVRRLLLRMRKMISIACLGLIFDPNDATVKQKFLSTVTPIMDNIRANRGISDYRIEINDTVESRERRELPCNLYFKPYNALEYIDLNFVVTPEAVSFDNI